MIVVWQGLRAGAWRSGPASPEHGNEKQPKTPKVDSRGEWPGTKTQGQVKEFQAAIYQKRYSEALHENIFRKVLPQEVKNLRALRPSGINDLERFGVYSVQRITAYNKINGKQSLEKPDHSPMGNQIRQSHENLNWRASRAGGASRAVNRA